MKFLFAGFAIVPVLFYIIACATTNWTTGSFSFVDAKIGPFKSTVTVYGSDTDYTGCYTSISDSDCSKFKATEAFTIMALILAAGAGVSAFVPGKPMITAAVYAVSGIFGMIGWAIWYSYQASIDSSYSAKIGYSQALVITAWVTSLAFVGVVAAMGRGASS